MVSEVGGGGQVPCQQSGRYQRAGAGNQTSGVEFQLHWQTIMNVFLFFSLIEKSLKGSTNKDSAAAAAAAFQFGGSRTEAEPQGALHYSAEASLTHRPFM